MSKIEIDLSGCNGANAVEKLKSALIKSKESKDTQLVILGATMGHLKNLLDATMLIGKEYKGITSILIEGMFTNHNLVRAMFEKMLENSKVAISVTKAANTNQTNTGSPPRATCG